MAIRVFVSHSAADENLASALVNCIFSCMMLEDHEVRCTSVPGHKLPIGGETAATLRDELGESSVVIGLLTRNALTSSWVLFELGATWGARKKIQPILCGDISYSDLPGPLSGNHAARLSEKNDLSQFIDELSHTIGAKKRSAAKIESSISKLIEADEEHSKVSLKAVSVEKVKSNNKIPEPTISGMKYSELKNILKSQKLNVPGALADKDEDFETTVFELFIANATIFSDGIQSNHESGSPGDFLYQKVGLQLVPYDLVKFEKLPASQAKRFKRLVLSSGGQKFIAHFNRLRHASE